jgi:hypothetical protein
MSSKKLKVIYIIIAGLVLSIGIAVGIFQYCIKPTQASIEALNARYSAASATYATKAAVQAQLVAAIAANNVTMAKYNAYVKKLMPPISFEDRATGMIAMWKEQLETSGPFLEKWVNHLNSKNGKGAALLLPISLSAPPVDPNSSIFAAPVLSISLGSATAVGSFASICDQVRAWNKCPRLAQVDGLTLDGAGNFLVGKYNVTIYLFPQGKAGPTVAMAGGAAAAPAPAPAAAPAAAAKAGGSKASSADSDSGGDESKGGGIGSKLKGQHGAGDE